MLNITPLQPLFAARIEGGPFGIIACHGAQCGSLGEARNFVILALTAETIDP